MNDYVHAMQGMRRIKRIHFIGIGGSGMSGIAEVLLNLGYDVSGSDIQKSNTTLQLQELGAAIKIGHHASNIDGANVIVTSTAVKEDNPEVIEARQRRIPIVPRALMLGELMRFRHGIAVAGTHGKTTTTSLVSSILAEAGLDPTFVIGGRLNSAGANAKLGLGKHLVAEADESDASFLHLHPMAAILTNIDADHMSTYGGDFEKLRQTFIDFLHHLPFYGVAVLCLDDPEVAKIVDRVHRPIVTYGSTEDCDFQLLSMESMGMKTRFEVRMPDGISQFIVNLPGRHSILNSIAAIAIAYDLGVPKPAIRRALQQFKGIGRRFQVHPDLVLENGGRVMVMEDYGHHPTEVNSVLSALTSAFPEKRIVLAFQPHRYSRTQELFDDFVNVLFHADPLILTEVYPAGEKKIPNADGRALSRALRAQGKSELIFVEQVQEIKAAYLKIARDGDLLIMMGAGDIGSMAHQMSEHKDK